LKAVIANSGEGMVTKRLDVPFGEGWVKTKRLTTYDCVVTDLDPHRATLRLSLNGEDCGWCPARSAFESIRVGDFVEVAAECRHPSGKFRSARFVRAVEFRYGLG